MVEALREMAHTSSDTSVRSTLAVAMNVVSAIVPIVCWLAMKRLEIARSVIVSCLMALAVGYGYVLVLLLRRVVRGVARPLILRRPFREEMMKLQMPARELSLFRPRHPLQGSLSRSPRLQLRG